MSNVIRIHINVVPPATNARSDERLRSVYWKGAQNFWAAAKEARKSGRPALAADILRSARQALAIATAADAKATLSRFIREERIASSVRS